MQIGRLEPKTSKKSFDTMLEHQLSQNLKLLGNGLDNVYQAIQRKVKKIKKKGKKSSRSMYSIYHGTKTLNIIMQMISPTSRKFEKYTIKHLHFELGHL